MSEQAMPALTPDEYKRILQGFSLEDIQLVGCSMSGGMPPDVAADRVKKKIDDEASYEMLSDNTVAILVSYMLRARVRNQVVAKVSANYRLIFHSSETFSDEFFAIYKAVSLHLNSWPFFRELVASLTARMNVPRLTLPLFKSTEPRQ